MVSPLDLHLAQSLILWPVEYLTNTSVCWSRLSIKSRSLTKRKKPRINRKLTNNDNCNKARHKHRVGMVSLSKGRSSDRFLLYGLFSRKIKESLYLIVLNHSLLSSKKVLAMLNDCTCMCIFKVDEMKSNIPHPIQAYFDRHLNLRKFSYMFNRKI